MARRAAKARKRSPRFKGLKPATFRFEAGQLEALRAEALRRAVARGSGKPDASELVRDAVDAWLAKARLKP